MNRNILIHSITKFILPERAKQLDKDYIDFELELAKIEDLEQIVKLCIDIDQDLKLPNPHNSCLLYITGITNDFDFERERCDTIGGSPPDIDIDFDAAGRELAVEYIIDKWGRDCVANIITHGTFQPKSLTRRYYKMMEANEFEMKSILKKIPEPQFGKEAKLKEVIEGNDKKGYEPHPELTKGKYEGWYRFTKQLEGMIANFGIHAAGIVISDDPIYNTIPMWKNRKAERITQFDMKEVEELGKIKFDFLVIKNLDILRECCKLIKQYKNEDINPWTLPDQDPKAYTLLASGLLQGVFQMETGAKAKYYMTRIPPKSIEDISAITSINRPGLQAKLDELGGTSWDEIYIDNLLNGTEPEDMPEQVKEVLKETYYVPLYQESVMKIMSDIGGFDLRTTDDVRRAMG